MNDDIKKALKEIVGEDNFTDRLIDMVSYSYDASSTAAVRIAPCGRKT